MTWKAQMNERGVIQSFRDTDTGEQVSVKEFERRMQMQGAIGPNDGSLQAQPAYPQSYPVPGSEAAIQQGMQSGTQAGMQPYQAQPAPQTYATGAPAPYQQAPAAGYPQPAQQGYQQAPSSPLVQSGAVPVGSQAPSIPMPATGRVPTTGMLTQGKNLRLEGQPGHIDQTRQTFAPRKGKGFLDATSIAILMPTLVLLALIIAAAHKKRLFPWQTIRTFNPPSGLMTPRDYERSYVCPPNGRRHGRLGKKNPNSTWSEVDGVVIPFGFLARTHLPVTIPMGRLPNKNMFIVAPSGSGKTTLMRAVIKALLAKPCVIIALEAKANDPNLDERREGFKYTVLPEAQHAGFRTLYFNPLDSESICWNPLDQDAVTFATSIVQDINSLPPEEQHWAERDLGYIEGLTQLLKWGGVQVMGEDENGQPSQLDPLPCNPYGLMKLVNNRRNIVESLRKLKADPNINAGELGELTQRLSSIIRTDSDWDKNIQGVRGRLRMFKNQAILKCTERSNVDLKTSMHEPTVLIFGAPASLGPDAESLAACFVHQLQQALHTRYGTKSVLPLFAFFDEYQTLNIDLAGRLSAIVRGANGGLTIILQNISQITSGGGQGVAPELKTIFSNSAVRVCLHNADETTAKFFSEEIGKHAVVVPGIADHFQANGFGIFPTSWNRIHSQQVVARVDTDSIKRMEKHHALVYLSPAGDPEFGETKPFMCDLRGIEEIAKLHLLHNVSARKQSSPDYPEGAPVPGAAAPSFATPAGSLPFPSRPAGNMPTPELGDMAAMAAQAAATGFDQTGVGPGYTNGYPMGSQGAPVAASSAPAATNSVNSGSSGNPSSTNNGASRLCPNCTKLAGKGKFCIECGQFIGLPQAELSTSAQVVAPVAASNGIIPSYAEANPAASSPSGNVAVDSFGNVIDSGEVSGNGLSALPGQQATPRYGGLRPQTRDAMPSKRGLFESASEIANTAQQVLNPNGPNSASEPNLNQTRRPMTSLNPDVSHLGLDNGKKPGVEF
ncbi:MAG: Type secretory system conjugative transfer family protein [Cyanobacteriota bacterium erpe_2018_sw_21hr_WHONDRS-SW48-000092_B_bin.40]|nr:Type secretory system conjugative transfer family protein [Cyanobacteriota bacterium erpe_2018_sw_21hr_WHONDRS-SW48-000092_B_bin.40]